MKNNHENAFFMPLEILNEKVEPTAEELADALLKETAAFLESNTRKTGKVQAKQGSAADALPAAERQTEQPQVSQPEQAAEPETTPEEMPLQEPQQAPVLEAQPEPQPEQAAEPETTPEEIPLQEPQQAPVLEAQPEPQPEQAAEPETTPGEMPLQEPQQAPVLEAQSEPEFLSSGTPLNEDADVLWDVDLAAEEPDEDFAETTPMSEIYAPYFTPAPAKKIKAEPESPPPAEIPEEDSWASGGIKRYQKKRSKAPIVVFAVIVALFFIGVLLWFTVFKEMWAMRDAQTVYVSSVAEIAGINLSGAPRFAGIVEPQKTIAVNKDATKNVKEVYVHEGDLIEVGTKLFTYETTETQIDLDAAKLDLIGIENKITELNNQIKELEKERNAASSEDKLGYTLQIQSLNLDIRQTENSLTAKKNEIENLEKFIENVDVVAEESGVVKSINTTGASDSMGNPLPFISILKTGDFRVKGTVTELNYRNLSVGLPITVRSRIDPELTWTGVVESIDQEKAADNANDFYWNGSTGETSSKYSFYVTLDTLDGLMLGQHVYIELSAGDSTEKEGIWLPSYYILSEDDGSYVWVRGTNEKLEKRSLTLGEYDAEMDTYQILGGITEEDYIAFPDEGFTPGMPTMVQDGALPNNTENGMLNPGVAEGGGGGLQTFDHEENGNPAGDYAEDGTVSGPDAAQDADLPEGGGNNAEPDSNTGNDAAVASPGNLKPRESEQQITPSNGDLGVFG